MGVWGEEERERERSKIRKTHANSLLELLLHGDADVVNEDLAKRGRAVLRCLGDATGELLLLDELVGHGLNGVRPLEGGLEWGGKGDGKREFSTAFLLFGD